MLNMFKMSTQQNNPQPYQNQQFTDPYYLQTNYDYLLKILLIGDSGVGKSALMMRYVNEQYEDKSIPTIGVDFKIKTSIINSKIFKLQIWDTAGQERFRTITSSYYRGAHGIIIVYDVSNEDTFNNLKFWLSEINTYALPSSKMILVGNKSDVSLKSRQVSYETASNYAKSNNMIYVETSAKNGTNINLAFDEIIREISGKNCELLADKKKPSNRSMTKNTQIMKTNQSKSYCC